MNKNTKVRRGGSFEGKKPVSGLALGACEGGGAASQKGESAEGEAIEEREGSKRLKRKDDGKNRGVFIQGRAKPERD